MLRGKAPSAMTTMFLTHNLETGVEDGWGCLTLFRTVHISSLKLVSYYPHRENNFLYVFLKYFLLRILSPY